MGNMSPQPARGMETSRMSLLDISSTEYEKCFSGSIGTFQSMEIILKWIRSQNSWNFLIKGNIRNMKFQSLV